MLSMTVEREVGVVRPQKHHGCGTCVFADRAIKQAVGRYSQPARLARIINVTCFYNGSGGSKQVEPGKWVEFQSRTIRVTPDPSSPVSDEWLEGTIPVCPTYPIEGLGEEYPSSPDLIVRIVRTLDNSSKTF